MFDTRIEILEYTEERDEYNDLTKTLRRVAVCYAQRTENGGRENLYAGRIAHENERSIRSVGNPTCVPIWSFATRGICGR